MMRITQIAFCLLFVAGLALAEENAALRTRGARIEVTCDHPRPLNDKWNKPVNMLKETRPAGPIIHDLPSARITVSLPVPMTITKVGILSGDYRNTFAMGKDIRIEAPGHGAATFTLARDSENVQFFDYAARGDQITVHVTSAYPPRDEKTDQKRVYGGINQVQVLVTEDLDKLFAIPASYARDLPVYVLRTPNLDPAAKVEVIGKPREVAAHPCTIWDKQDIVEIKAQIDKHAKAQEAYEGIVAYCEKALNDKMSVPDDPDRGDNPEVAAQHQAVAIGIGNLGIGYALSGNEAYAAEAKRLLLELAKRYEGWPVHAHPKFTHDSAKWSWQRLNEAIWIIPAAWGFDLICRSAAMTEADRRAIIDHFIMPCVRDIMRSAGVIRAPTNWSVIGAAGVMIGARASGDREFYEKSIMGLKWKPGERSLADAIPPEPGTCDGGIFYHIDHGIDDDGMWAEGAIGYQFMAMRGLLVIAEILWHDGIDVYGYRNGRLKLVFDSPIWFCYPGGNSSPAVHDSGGASLFGRDAHLYQYAKRRYGDYTYDAILRHVEPSLETVFNLFLPAADFSPVYNTELPEVPSILFPGVGFAICRAGAGEDSKYLFVDYGPSRSHGHPDKLNLSLYALGQELFADAGSAWYSTGIYKRYYSHSLAHNTVSANGMNQIMTGGRLEAYGSLGDLSLVRTSCDTAIPGTALDRTLLMSSDRLYDIFMIKSGVPFTFDLPYHCHGELEQSVATKPWQEHPKEALGYAYFSDPVSARVDGDWACSWTVKRGRVDLRVVGEPGTEVVFAETPKGSRMLPTAMVRRTAKETVIGAAMDIVSGKAGIKSVRKLADDPNGYGLIIELVSGGQEVVMVNSSDRRLNSGEWATDARVAFLQTDGKAITGFFLAGGTEAVGPVGRVTSSTPTLLACRTVQDGLVQFANWGESASRVTVIGMAPVEAVQVAAPEGRRGAKVDAVTDAGGVSFDAAAVTEYGLSRGKQPTVAEYEAEIRRAKLAAMFAEETRQRKAMKAAATEQAVRARKAGVPEGYCVVVQAEKPFSQEGGKVNVTSKKTATYGDAFLNWDDPGHEIEYEVEVMHDGYYQVALKYCREGGPVTRSFRVDGEYPHEAFREMEMAGTGGWSNGADNWRYFTLRWPRLDQPFLVRLTKGRHLLRLGNVSGGGLNLDYIVIAAPDMKTTREAVER